MPHCCGRFIVTSRAWRPALVRKAVRRETAAGVYGRAGVRERRAVALAPAFVVVVNALTSAIVATLLAADVVAAEKTDAIVAPPIAKAKAAILRSLSVPEVAEFRDVTSKVARTPEGRLVTVVCGLVNTYSNGGFVGFQRFAFVVDPVQLIVVAADTPPLHRDTATQLCG